MNQYVPDNNAKYQQIAQQLVESAINPLTEADLKIMQFYVDDMVHASYLAKDIAKKLKIHPATVVRLAKKLGFNGHPELRDYLNRFAQPHYDAKERHIHTINQINGSILQATIKQEIEHLQLLASAITQEQLDNVCHLLLAAQKIFIYGQDNNEANGDYLSRRLKRSGIDSQNLTYDYTKLAETFSFAKPNDVLFIIFTNKLNTYTEQLIKTAKNLQLNLIAISNLNNFKYAQEINLLRIYRGENKGTKSVSPAPVLINSIIRNLTMLDEIRILQGLHHFEMVQALANKD